jgi:hypothetical protein
MKQFLLKNKFLLILIHILAWLVFLLLLVSLVPKPPIVNPVLTILVPDLFFISFFYINFFFLVPKFFFPRKYLVFVVICISFLILTIAVPSSISESSLIRPGFPAGRDMQGFQPGPPPGFGSQGFQVPKDKMPPIRLAFLRPEFSYTIFVFIFILTLSTGIRILGQWQQSEKEKVKAELAFLKAQINPHFMFNTLNNIYSMAVSKAERTPEAIEMFSDMMRFVIYETTNDFVPLSKKIEYIDTYITLQKLRFPSTVKVNYQKTGDCDSLQIAPLILMPFIENAFKHGISTETESNIDIQIDIESNKLKLYVKNSINKLQDMENGISQLGIENTKKRLELMYPGDHTLNIIDSRNEYVVSLHLNLK